MLLYYLPSGEITCGAILGFFGPSGLICYAHRFLMASPVHIPFLTLQPGWVGQLFGTMLPGVTLGGPVNWVTCEDG